MKEIVIPMRGKSPFFVQLDEQFYLDVVCFRWSISTIGDQLFYAKRSTKDVNNIYMHRYIMELYLGRKLEPFEEVDHIDNNGLNNQVSNLRIVTRSQNLANQRHHRDSLSDYIGVHYNSRYVHPYRIKLMVEYKNVHGNIGFDTPEEAAYNRDILSLKYFGNSAKLNFPDKISEYEQKLANGWDVETNERKYTSKIPGISYQASIKKWKCNVYKDGKQIYVGIFDAEELANAARVQKCNELGINPNKSRLKKKK